MIKGLWINSGNLMINEKVEWGKKMGKSNKSILINISLISSLFVLVILLSSFVFRVWISPPVDAELEGNTPLEKIIQVNVLNATGKPGLANDVRRYLRNRGFDVVEVDNYPEISKNSKIIDRVADKISTHKLSYAIGIPDSLISLEIDSSLYLKASIIIGQDYKELRPFQ